MARLNEKLTEVAEAITPARRRYLYRVAGMVCAILAAHGLVEADTLADYLQAAAVVLGVAPAEVAARNVR